MRRRGRWALGFALAGCFGIVGFLLVGGRRLEAWLVPFQGDTEVILPDPALHGETLEANLRVSPALRKYVHRFQARMLLRFVATRHDRPVLARSSDRHALDSWIDLEPRGARETIGVAEVLSALRARGWKIVGTVLPRSALVALPPGDVVGPSVEAGSTDFAIYNVSDLVLEFEDRDASFLRHLKDLIESSTGGGAAWSEPYLMDVDERVGAIIVNAPREMHAEVQGVLALLRRPD